VSGKFQIKSKILNFFDKGKGALLEIEDSTYDKGELICKAVGGIYVRGLGGFGGERGPSRDKENLPPKRAPDAVQEEITRENQAQIYRLSGDYNPLHIDPDMAQMVGFPKPILHGLCTYGYACRALLKHCADNDASKLKSLRVRFANPVIPGDTLVTEMWKEDSGNGQISVIFQTKVKSSGQIVLANAVATFQTSPTNTQTGPSTSSQKKTSSAKLKSAPIFEGMDKIVKGNPALLKKVNAVYEFNLKANNSTTTYTVDVKNQATVGVHHGKVPNVKPDCTITMTDEDYFSMATGSLNAMSAFASGKLSVEGNIMLAQKLSQLTDQAKL